jgi:hypothetical protein
MRPALDTSTRGKEAVGAILDALHENGWWTIHKRRPAASAKTSCRASLRLVDRAC